MVSPSVVSVSPRCHHPDITAFVALLVEKGLAPSTVEAIYNLLAMILRAAVYDRLLPASP